jgi:Na+/melibiose symporter-like transporter
MGPIRGVLRQRYLRRWLGAGLISLTGDWVLRVGLAYYVYRLTGSTLASALMLLSSFLPQIVLGSLAGVFVDRWDHKATMIVTNLLLAAGLLPLLVVHHAGQVWVVYAVMAWEGCAQQFFGPAQQALLPRLIDDAYLVTANALNGQNSNLSRLIGSALGGIVAAAGGISALALVDIASFLAATALIARIRAERREARQRPAGTSLGRRVACLRAEWVDGLRLSAQHRVLRVIMIFLLVTSVGEGIMGTLFAPFVRSVLHGSDTAYGLVVSAQAVGGIVGGLLAAAFGSRFSASRLLGWSAVAFGLIDLAMFLYPLAWVGVWPAAVCMILAGLPGAVMLAAVMTLFQRATADSHRGRIYGALTAVEGIALVTGTLAAGFLGQTLGIVPVLVVQGSGFLAAGALVLIALQGSSASEDPGLPEAGSAPLTKPRRTRRTRRAHRTRRRTLTAVVGTVLMAAAGAAGTAMAAARPTTQAALTANWYESAPYYSTLDSSAPDLARSCRPPARRHSTWPSSLPTTARVIPHGTVRTRSRPTRRWLPSSARSAAMAAMSSCRRAATTEPSSARCAGPRRQRRRLTSR